MKRLRWQLLIVFLALVAISLLLLGQNPVLEQIVPVQPATGGVYSEAVIGSLGRLNPVLDVYNPADRDVSRLLFSALVSFDDRGIPMGDLAESWGISQDGMVYNFSLRPEALWHDGERVTSNDVAFTIELLRSEDFPTPPDVRDLWNEIEIIHLNDKTLQFRLPEPFAPFLDYLTFGILPEHLLGDLSPEELIDAPFNLEPVGSGPYLFDHLLLDNGRIIGVVLSAFDEYYADRSFIDQVVFRYYPDAETALDAYKQGEVLGVSQITTEVLPDVLKEPDLKLYSGRLPHLTLIYLNLGDPELPFFQEVEVRRALLMGINRQWIVDNILYGQAINADGPIFPGTWAYFEGIEHVGYDRDGALDLLKGAGYTIPAEGGSVRAKEGVELSFELAYPDTANNSDMVEAVRRDWAQLGVQVDLKPVTYEKLVNDYLNPRDYQAALVDLNLARSPDPDPYPFWDQTQVTNGQNYAMWNDRQASEYLEQARVTVDIGERTKAYRNFQVRFTTEMPALPLFYPVYSYAVDEQVQGVRMGSFFEPSDRFSNITTWYLLARRPMETADLTATP